MVSLPPLWVAGPMSDARCPETMLAGLVTGRIVPPRDPDFLEAALAAARAHGLVALVHERLRATCWQDLPQLGRQIWWRAASAAAAAVPSIRLGYATASDVLWSNLRALPSWSQRIGYVVQTAWPSASYMTRRYAIDRPWKLPYYYLKRLVCGLAKLGRRPGAA